MPHPTMRLQLFQLIMLDNRVVVTVTVVVVVTGDARLLHVVVSQKPRPPARSACGSRGGLCCRSRKEAGGPGSGSCRRRMTADIGWSLLSAIIDASFSSHVVAQPRTIGSRAIGDGCSEGAREGGYATCRTSSNRETGWLPVAIDVVVVTGDIEHSAKRPRHNR